MLVLLWQRMDQKIQSGRQFFHVTLLQDYLNSIDKEIIDQVASEVRLTEEFEYIHKKKALVGFQGRGFAEVV
jgi:hypothetical protein